jgi:hypothetical protein
MMTLALTMKSLSVDDGSISQQRASGRVSDLLFDLIISEILTNLNSKIRPGFGSLANLIESEILTSVGSVGRSSFGSVSYLILSYRRFTQSESAYPNESGQLLQALVFLHRACFDVQ